MNSSTKYLVAIDIQVDENDEEFGETPI